MADQEYELFAIRYATRDVRRSDHFIGGDPHDGPMPMDYFMWLARGGGRTFVIDTGFNAEVANRRKRTFLRCPVETLGAFDIDVAGIEDVILTHLHYDHVGNFDRFPNARFHLQEREIAYATGSFMRYPRLSHSFEVEVVCGIVRLNYARRVLFYDGDAELAPDLTINAAGGNAGGVRPAAETGAGRELHHSRPRSPRDEAISAPSPELEGIAVRLDVPPSGAAPVRADYLSGH
jgi:Metallo-beta-lactamase superfamily